MKRFAIAAAAALLLAGNAQAQSAPAWYGELGYTFLKIDAGGTSFRPGAIRGLLGYAFHPMFAVEGMLAGGVSDDTKNTPVPVTLKMNSMYGIFVRPRYVYQTFEGFARIGWAHTDVDFRNVSDSDSDFAWGLGANWYFDPRMYVGADWMRYSNQSNHHVDGLTFSFGYRW